MKKMMKMLSVAAIALLAVTACKKNEDNAGLPDTAVGTYSTACAYVTIQAMGLDNQPMPIDEGVKVENNSLTVSFAPIGEIKVSLTNVSNLAGVGNIFSVVPIEKTTAIPLPSSPDAPVQGTLKLAGDAGSLSYHGFQVTAGSAKSLTVNLKGTFLPAGAPAGSEIAISVRIIATTAVG